LSLTGDRRVDVHAKSDQAFRSACVRNHRDVVVRLLSLSGWRAIPTHVMADYNVKDTPERTLIAIWASGAAGRGNVKHIVLGGLERVALAEVLQLLARPW
jgi:hypothetical protein